MKRDHGSGQNKIWGFEEWAGSTSSFTLRGIQRAGDRRSDSEGDQILLWSDLAGYTVMKILFNKEYKS